MTRNLRALAVLGAALVLVACGNALEPAQKALAEAEAAIAAVGADATKYAPGAMKEVDAKLAELRAALERQDYAAVIAGAPALLAEAKALAVESAARKQEFFDTVNKQWGELATVLPQNVAAIEAQIANYEKARRLPGDLTQSAVAEAKLKLEDAQRLWGEATQAFAQGKLEEAIGMGLSVQAQAAALMAKLKMPGAEAAAGPQMAMPASPAAPAAAPAPPTAR